MTQPKERTSQDVLRCQWRRAQTNVQIYIIADKYMIDGLKETCKSKLSSNEDESNDSGFIAVVGDGIAGLP